MADPTALQVLQSIEGILKELVKLASTKTGDPMKPVNLEEKWEGGFWPVRTTRVVQRNTKEW